MGSIVSKSTRRYPSAAARGGAENLLKSTIPKHTSDIRLPPPKPTTPSRPNIEAESINDVIKPVESVFQGEKNPKLNDVALGLEDFDSDSGSGNYNSQLNDMLKKLGPVHIYGNVTQPNNIEINPVAQMFKVREFVNERGRMEQEDLHRRRTVFSAAELAEILDLSRKNWTKKELEDHYHLDPTIWDDIGKAFRKFIPEKSIDVAKSAEDGSFEILMRHGAVSSREPGLKNDVEDKVQRSEQPQ
ncbi:hypothetical protein V1520DRAFT_340337 [Lipomyces starkeyi]|uniref:Uncharacterized protein n=1 Tax=Lipomyces starkeyi NRRL Y-11557 TaxID=675824 RepID=A0A1E3QAG5_LIPST|nr:hypothetical protein LIPSTDRAFT_70299 [Lipomyces starkeyi NRRL Y-11557]